MKLKSGAYRKSRQQRALDLTRSQLAELQEIQNNPELTVWPTHRLNKGKTLEKAISDKKKLIEQQKVQLSLNTKFRQ